MSSSKNVRALLKKCKEAIDQELYKEGLDITERIFLNDANNFNALLMAGLISARCSDIKMEKAIEFYERAAELNEESINPIQGLIEVYTSLNSWKELVKYQQKLISLLTNSPPDSMPIKLLHKKKKEISSKLVLSYIHCKEYSNSFKLLSTLLSSDSLLSPIFQSPSSFNSYPILPPSYLPLLQIWSQSIELMIKVHTSTLGTTPLDSGPPPLSQLYSTLSQLYWIQFISSYLSYSVKKSSETEQSSTQLWAFICSTSHTNESACQRLPQLWFSYLALPSQELSKVTFNPESWLGIHEKIDFFQSKIFPSFLSSSLLLSTPEELTSLNPTQSLSLISTYSYYLLFSELKFLSSSNLSLKSVTLPNPSFHFLTQSSMTTEWSQSLALYQWSHSALAESGDIFWSDLSIFNLLLGLLDSSTCDLVLPFSRPWQTLADLISSLHLIESASDIGLGLYISSILSPNTLSALSTNSKALSPFSWTTASASANPSPVSSLLLLSLFARLFAATPSSTSASASQYLDRLKSAVSYVSNLFHWPASKFSTFSSQISFLQANLLISIGFEDQAASELDALLEKSPNFILAHKAKLMLQVQFYKIYEASLNRIQSFMELHSELEYDIELLGCILEVEFGELERRDTNEDAQGREHFFERTLTTLSKIQDSLQRLPSWSRLLIEEPLLKRLHSSFLCTKGKAHWYVQKYDESATFFRESIKTLPRTLDEPYAYLGQYYLNRNQQGDDRRAKAMFQAALDINPTSAIAGKSLYELTSSLKLLESIVATSSSIQASLWAYKQLAELYLKDGGGDKFSRSESLFQQCLKVESKSWDIWYGLATSYQCQGKYVAAVKAFQVALKFASQTHQISATQFQLGKTYGLTHDRKAGLDLMSKLLSTSPTYLPALFEASQMCIEESRLQAVANLHGSAFEYLSLALNYANQGLSACQDQDELEGSTSFHYLLAKIYSLSFKWENSISHFRSVLEKYPETASFHYQLGLCYYEMNQLEASWTCFRKVASLEPRWPNSWSALGCIALKKSDFDKAKHCFIVGLKLESSSASLWTNLGCAYLCGARQEDALKAFQRAQILDPASARNWTLLGLAKSDLSALKTATSLSSSYIWSHLSLAVHLLDSPEATKGKGEKGEFDSLASILSQQSKASVHTLNDSIKGLELNSLVQILLEKAGKKSSPHQEENTSIEQVFESISTLTQQQGSNSHLPDRIVQLYSSICSCLKTEPSRIDDSLLEPILCIFENSSQKEGKESEQEDNPEGEVEQEQTITSNVDDQSLVILGLLIALLLNSASNYTSKKRLATILSKLTSPSPSSPSSSPLVSPLYSYANYLLGTTSYMSIAQVKRNLSKFIHAHPTHPINSFFTVLLLALTHSQKGSFQAKGSSLSLSCISNLLSSSSGWLTEQEVDCLTLELFALSTLSTQDMEGDNENNDLATILSRSTKSSHPQSSSSLASYQISKIHDYAKGGQLLKKALSQCGDDGKESSNHWYQLGRFYIDIESYESASFCLSQSQSLGHLPAAYTLFYLQLCLKKAHGASKALNSCLPKTSLFHKLGFGLIQMRLKKWPKSLKLLKEVQDDDGYSNIHPSTKKFITDRIREVEAEATKI